MDLLQDSFCFFVENIVGYMLIIFVQTLDILLCIMLGFEDAEKWNLQLNVLIVILFTLY